MRAKIIRFLMLNPLSFKDAFLIFFYFDQAAAPGGHAPTVRLLVALVLETVEAERHEPSEQQD